MSEEVKYEPLPENKAKWKQYKNYFGSMKRDGIELAKQIIEDKPFDAARFLRSLERLCEYEGLFTAPIWNDEHKRVSMTDLDLDTLDCGALVRKRVKTLEDSLNSED